MGNKAGRTARERVIDKTTFNPRSDQTREPPVTVSRGRASGQEQSKCRSLKQAERRAPAWPAPREGEQW